MIQFYINYYYLLFIYVHIEKHSNHFNWNLSVNEIELHRWLSEGHLEDAELEPDPAKLAKRKNALILETTRENDNEKEIVLFKK